MEHTAAQMSSNLRSNQDTEPHKASPIVDKRRGEGDPLEYEEPGRRSREEKDVLPMRDRRCFPPCRNVSRTVVGNARALVISMPGTAPLVQRRTLCGRDMIAEGQTEGQDHLWN